MRRGDEARIAAAAAAALGDDHALIFVHEIGKHRAGLRLFHHGSRRHVEHHLSAAVPGFIRAFAVFAAFGAKMFAHLKILQRAHAAIDCDDHIAAFAAIAAVRAAFGHKFLAPETHTAAAAAAGFYVNFGVIDKHKLIAVPRCWLLAINSTAASVPGKFNSQFTVTIQHRPGVQICVQK
ncbi:MAG: hypothetical protein ALAOOOJD_02724 [bacterium]|nr:hypothetical protein [bacterium]